MFNTITVNTTIITHIGCSILVHSITPAFILYRYATITTALTINLILIYISTIMYCKPI